MPAGVVAAAGVDVLCRPRVVMRTWDGHGVSCRPLSVLSRRCVRGDMHRVPSQLLLTCGKFKPLRLHVWQGQGAQALLLHADPPGEGERTEMI